jgi:hypothetical protein
MGAGYDDEYDDADYGAAEAELDAEDDAGWDQQDHAEEYADYLQGATEAAVGEDGGDTEVFAEDGEDAMSTQPADVAYIDIAEGHTEAGGDDEEQRSDGEGGGGGDTEAGDDASAGGALWGGASDADVGDGGDAYDYDDGATSD